MTDHLHLLRAPVATALLASGLAACDEESASGYLNADLGGPVRIDSVCSDGGCDSQETVSAEFTFSDRGVYLDTDRIQIRQYRIDYEVESAEEGDEPVPYFAAKITEDVYYAQSVTVDLLAVGNTQREWFEDNVPTDEIWNVTATVTVAGFDEVNAVFEKDVGHFQMDVANFSNLQGTVVTPTTPTGN